MEHLFNLDAPRLGSHCIYIVTRPVRRARDHPTTVIAKTGYSTAHTGLRVLGMPPPSSRSSVSIESDLGLVSKLISSGHSIGIPLSLIYLT